MAGHSIVSSSRRTKLADLADGLAIAVAASLPWSTSATGILAGLWLVALIVSLDRAELRRLLTTPAGGLPVLLVLFGIAGMLWADVSWIERWDGLGSFLKLLAIPLLFVQFRHSGRGLWVFGAYLIACVALLLLSTAISIWPDLWWQRDDFAVPVKNAATQSGEFVTCIAGLLFLAIECFERRRWLWLAGLLAVALGMGANMVFVATGRTALVILPVLVAILAARRLSRRGVLVLLAGTVLFAAFAWFSSAYFRERTTQLWTDYQTYETADAVNSSSQRIEFWKKSVAFIAEAPILGHGTGSIHSLFKRSIIGQTGPAASDASNPHNQTFAVAIQIGLIGAAVLWAMWIAHLLLFRGNGLAEWIGLAVVVQNVIGSLFNSHLFDFLQGWVYVFGVGVAGGMALKNRAAQRPANNAP